jgi:hypothetical protein
MGVTYRTRQISMGGREVALKVIQPELLGDDNVRRCNDASSSMALS